MPFRPRLLALVVALLGLALNAASAPAAAPRPDLAVSPVTDPPSVMQRAGAFSVTARVVNRGGSSARASRVGFLLSADRRLSADDVLLGDAALRALKAKKAVVLIRRLTLPAGLPAGRYVLLACADRRGQVTESAEGNNCRAATRRLELRAPEVQLVPTTTTVTVPAAAPPPPPAPPAPAPDTTAPAAPALTGTVPATTGADESPLVKGTAEAGARVRFYLDTACATTAVAATTADTDGSFAAGVPVPLDAVSRISATARDAAGNVSPCSVDVRYEQDSSTPAAPVLLATTPGSPAPDPTPTFAGTAEPSSIVTLYRGAACNGTPAGQAVADVSGAWDLELAVTANDTTAVTATATDPAGHTSLCSTPLAYRHDDTPPGTVVIGSTTPNVTGSDPTPDLNGTAEPGAAVSVFVGASCAGTAVQTVTAGGSGAWSATVAAALNASRAWSARARDAAGNESVACSAVRSYLHDDIAPGVPAFDSPATTPASPSPQTLITVRGTGTPGSSVRLHDAAGCAPGAFIGNVPVDSGGAWEAELQIPADAQNATTTFSINARDAAGNTSACAAAATTYVHDNVKPALSGVQIGPASPSASTSVTFTGQAEPGAKVFVFGGSNGVTLCTNPSLALNKNTPATADADGDFSITLTLTGQFGSPVEDGEQTLGVASRDAAGNLSTCSFVTYVLDRAADAPQFNSPASPGADAMPFLGGSAEPNAKVQLFANGDCTAPPLATVDADSDGGWGFQTTTAVVGTQDYSARQTDAAGNVSDCSGPYSYERDNDPPAVPVLVDTFPMTSGGPSFYVRGTADEGSFVTFYGTPGCDEGTELGSGGGGASFAYPGAQLYVESGTVTIYAKATDQVGNASACSSSSVTYTVTP